MTLTITLVCAAVLFALPVIAVNIVRSPAATRLVYGASMITSAILLLVQAARLNRSTAISLPK